ncbi:MAG: NAD-dependent epimerase/dehydratase family protein, partial [Armatimonadota bacterium]|nr:NAD-dependent epimerase/dehydratase family protein [Armatimonadota bacterium]
MKRLLILGGCGFLGQHLREQAKARGLTVHTMDIAGGDIPRDILDINAEDVRGYDRVYHLAGKLGTAETFEDPVTTVKVNVIGTMKVLQAAHVAAVPVTYVTLANQWLNPYSISKNAAAQFCAMYREYYGLPVQIAVTYNVFGKFQAWQPVRKIVPEFLIRLLEGRPIELFGGGQQFVDLVYAPDLARALLDNEQPGVQHFGSGRSLTVRDTALLCARSLGITAPQLKELPLRL